MRRAFRKRLFFFACALATALLSLPTSLSLHGASTDLISITVVVTDSETGQPINQAHLTLQFFEPTKLKFKKPKMIAYSAKTDAQGRYKFVGIYAGTVRLTVTDERHQTFGKDFEVTQDHSVLEVKLKPPQPLL